MENTALVLGGGGAKGAFQVGAERYLREECGMKWSVISGVSAGALNGALLSQGRPGALRGLWLDDLDAGKIYKGTFNLWTVLRMIFGALSIYDNSPLHERLLDEVDFRKTEVPFVFSTISLTSGETVTFQFSPGLRASEEAHDRLIKALLASTAVPVVWPPVELLGEKFEEPVHMVDGGLRQLHPIGAALDSKPNAVVVISNNPLDIKPERAPNNVVDIARRSVEIMMHELFHADVREFLKINAFVRQGNEILSPTSGRPYKAFPTLIVEPEESLGSPLDFSRVSVAARMRAGYLAAERAMRTQPLFGDVAQLGRAPA